jgi:invasion protein IalB
MIHSPRARGILAALSAAFLVAAPLPSLAQEKPAEEKPAAGGAAEKPPQSREVALKGDPSQSGWTKLCGNDPQRKTEICFTQRSFVTETNQPIIAMAVYDAKGAKEKFIRFILPLGFMLERGMRYTIDKEKPVAGKFQVCLANGCFAEVIVNDAGLKALKAGKGLKIEVQNQLNQVVAFSAPLEGFGAAFDGAPIDPKVIQEQNKKIEAELAKKLEDQKKLLQQQSAPQQ